MAAHLSADLLMPETRTMIKAMADQINFGHKPQASSSEHSDITTSEITPLSRNPVDEDPTAAPPSEGMQKLLNELSRKLFPHRHSKDENAKNPELLLEKLREDLSKLKPKPLEELTPSQPTENLDPTAAAILAVLACQPIYRRNRRQHFRPILIRTWRFIIKICWRGYQT